MEIWIFNEDVRMPYENSEIDEVWLNTVFFYDDLEVSRKSLKSQTN